MRNKPLPERPPGAVGSLDRGLQLLQVIRDYGSLRVTDAASLLGVSRSTAHRLLQTLVFRGFATQGDDQVYYPGSALDASPARRAWIGEFRRVCEPHMEVLARRSGESANLMIRVGGNVRFLQTTKASTKHSTNDRTGIVMPARASSGGKALLAELSDRELEKLYRDPLLGENTNYLDEEGFAELQDQLGAIRERGFAVNFEETERGVAAVGVAIRDREQRGIGALSVSTQTSRFGRQIRASLMNLLMAAKNEIEQDLQLTDLGFSAQVGSHKGGEGDMAL